MIPFTLRLTPSVYYVCDFSIGSDRPREGRCSGLYWRAGASGRVSLCVTVNEFILETPGF